MKLAAWNAGNAYLENKLNEIEKVIESVKPHVLIISEGNLRQCVDKSTVKISGYELFTAETITNSDIKNISRVIIYKHESVIAKLRPDLMNNTVDSIWLELGFRQHKKLLVGGLYRVWQHMGQGPDKVSLSSEAQLDRWKQFISQWEEALQEKETVVLGDINIDWLCCCTEDPPACPNKAAKWRSAKPLLDELNRRITPHGAVQLVRGATRSARGHSDSALDLVFTTAPEKMSDALVLFRSFSDHRLVQCTRYTKNIVISPRYVKKRTFKNFDDDKFVSEVRNTNMLDVYLCQDANKAAEMLTNKLNNILDKMAPVRKIQVRQNYAPWVSDECKREMAARDELQKKAVQSRKDEDWDVFKMFRNKVTRKVRKEKEKWQKKKMEHCQANSSTCWKNILGWLGWSSSGSPTKLYSRGRVETSPHHMANIMNEFYVQKVADIRAALPPPTEDPLARLRTIMAGSTAPQFNLQPVHPDTVDKIVKSLRNSKATGLDYIDTRILKLVRNEIVPALTHIINISIQTAVYPACYKTSKIIPLLKDSTLDKLDPSSFRPVALLPVASKVLERVVFLQVVEYMQTHGLLHPNHHGFRAHHSVTTAILQMYDTWMNAIENGEMVGLTLVDLSAAFDCVDVNLLLAKTELYNFSRHTQQFIWSFMTSRHQVTEIEGSTSSSLRVGDVGVAQGSLCGPLWYILYTSELPEVVHGENCPDARDLLDDLPVSPQNWEQPAWKPNYRIEDNECGTVVCYADDSSESVADTNIEELKTSMELQYSSTASFLTSSLLQVNSSKTHTMLLTTSQNRRQNNPSLTVTFGTTQQKASSVERILGLYLHENLKFREHLQDNKKSLIKSLNTRLNALKQIKKLTSFSQRLAIANGIFNSKVVFLISVWGGTEEYLLDAIQIIINKAMRVICNVGKSAKIADLQRMTNWMSVRQLAKYHSLMEARRILSNQEPQYLYNRLSAVLLAGQHNHNTRHGAQPAAPRLALVESSWLHRVVADYRRLPRDILELPRRGERDQAYRTRLRAWVTSVLHQ